MKSVFSFFRRQSEYPRLEKAAEQRCADAGSPKVRQSLLLTAREFLSPARKEKIERRVSDSVPPDATRNIKDETRSSRSSPALDSKSAAMPRTSPNRKNDDLLTEVRFAYREALRPLAQSKAPEFEGGNHEMSVSMLNSKLSTLLSNGRISETELKFIEKSLLKFKDELSAPTLNTLESAIESQRKKLGSPGSSPGATTNRSADTPRQIDSNQSTTAMQQKKTALTSDENKLRMTFERNLRASIGGNVQFNFTEVITIANRVFERLACDTQLTPENFQKNFQMAANEKLGNQHSEQMLLLLSFYGEQALRDAANSMKASPDKQGHPL